MAFADFESAINLVSQGPRLNLAGPGAQTHRSTQFLHSPQFTEFVDDAVGRGGIEFAGVSLSQPAHVARELYAGCLHTQANAKIRNFIFTGITNRSQHALDATLAKAARHQQTVVVRELFFISAISGF